MRHLLGIVLCQAGFQIAGNADIMAVGEIVTCEDVDVFHAEA
jgi:hypothetical protein